MKQASRVLVAKIGAPHGVRGEVRMLAYLDHPDGLKGMGPLYERSGRTRLITAMRTNKARLIVKFSGVDNREAAQELNGVELFVDRVRLGEPEEQDEFLHVDLIGLSVFDLADNRIGRVKAVHNFGAGDIVEIKLDKGKSEMIPFSMAAVPIVDITGGVLRVDPVAAGLQSLPHNSDEV